MSFRNPLIVFRKELRDVLRDKRTIRSMVIIPMVAFPLMFLGIGYIGAKSSQKLQSEVSTVMIQGGQDSPKVLMALRNFPSIRMVPYKDDAAREVSDKEAQALLKIPEGFDSAIAAGRAEQLSIGYYENDEKSELASTRLQKFFDNYREQMAREALAARGVPLSILEPFTVDARNIAPPSKVGAATFGALIPYLIIIFCFTGAMYPAMDTTAGEKERGTMETILSSPVSRTDLVIGKFFMVVTTSVVTALLSLFSLSLSFTYFKNALMAGSSVQMTVNLSSVLAVVVLILPLAVFFAALLLTVALLAKSYREAQSYVSPLVFIVIAPAIVGTLPGIELNSTTVFVPILNTCMVSKEIISGTYNWGHMGLVFGMTCVYAAIGLSAAVRMFNREEVLFRA